jgi:hypothetical protein
MSCAAPKLGKINLGVLSILDMEQVWSAIFAQRQRRIGLGPHATFEVPASISHIALGKPTRSKMPPAANPDHGLAGAAVATAALC